MRLLGRNPRQGNRSNAVDYKASAQWSRAVHYSSSQQEQNIFSSKVYGVAQKCVLSSVEILDRHVLCVLPDQVYAVCPLASRCVVERGD